MDKKKKIVVGSLVAGIVVICMFVFLIANFSNEGASIEDGEGLAAYSNSNNGNVQKDNKKGDNVENNKQSHDGVTFPFETISVGGKTLTLDTDDFAYSSKGELFISESFLEENLVELIEIANNELFIGNLIVGETGIETSVSNNESYLSDYDYLKLTTKYEGRGHSGHKIVFGKNENFKKEPISVATDVYKKGLSYYVETLSNGVTEKLVSTKYNLKNEFKQFNALVGLNSSVEQAKGKFKVRFLNENEDILYETKEFELGDLGEEVSFSLETVQILTIEIYSIPVDKSSYSAEINIADPLLTK